MPSVTSEIGEVVFVGPPGGFGGDDLRHPLLLLAVPNAAGFVFFVDSAARRWAAKRDSLCFFNTSSAYEGA